MLARVRDGAGIAPPRNLDRPTLRRRRLRARSSSTRTSASKPCTAARVSLAVSAKAGAAVDRPAAAAHGRSRRLERRDDRVDVAARERPLVLGHDVGRRQPRSPVPARAAGSCGGWSSAEQPVADLQLLDCCPAAVGDDRDWQAPGGRAHRRGGRRPLEAVPSRTTSATSTATLRCRSHAAARAASARNAGPVTRPRTGSHSRGSPANDRQRLGLPGQQAVEERQGDQPLLPPLVQHPLHHRVLAAPASRAWASVAHRAGAAPCSRGTALGTDLPRSTSHDSTMAHQRLERDRPSLPMDHRRDIRRNSGAESPPRTRSGRGRTDPARPASARTAAAARCRRGRRGPPGSGGAGGPVGGHDAQPRRRPTRRRPPRPVVGAPARLAGDAGRVARPAAGERHGLPHPRLAARLRRRATVPVPPASGSTRPEGSSPRSTRTTTAGSCTSSPRGRTRSRSGSSSRSGASPSPARPWTATRPVGLGRRAARARRPPLRPPRARRRRRRVGGHGSFPTTVPVRFPPGL